MKEKFPCKPMKVFFLDKMDSRNSTTTCRTSGVSTTTKSNCGNGENNAHIQNEQNNFIYMCVIYNNNKTLIECALRDVHKDEMCRLVSAHQQTRWCLMCLVFVFEYDFLKFHCFSINFN